ncbi:type II secretion system GspH family protein [Candidatus Microgenomates bacterium]|nr:type II secretion system GspH family protein [Candidatus Microgenomates bacterium]
MKKGFTLIELLITIAIIGILSTLAMANFFSARERGRDAQRKSDLKSMQNALQLFYSTYGKYPTSSSGSIVGCGTSPAFSSCTWGSAFTVDDLVIMNTLPKDPLPTTAYFYTRTDLDTYSLKACLENKSDDKGQADSGSSSWCPTQYTYTVAP